MGATASLPSSIEPARTQRVLLLIAVLWAAGVAIVAARGGFAPLVGAPFAALVALGIALPTLAYFRIARVRMAIDAIGLRPLTLMHAWRVPAGLAFIAYGLQGQLPPAFWIPAGFGDVLVGLYALRLLRGGGADARFYRRFHVLGFADFVIAVGSGLVHTLMLDPRMAPIATLPLALIPLFGVGLSGASHLVAFHWLRRGSVR